MKRPKWTDKTVGPMMAPALRDAAKALRMDAKDWRTERNHRAALAVESVACALERVADGQTWAQAFGWPDLDSKKKGA